MEQITIREQRSQGRLDGRLLWSDWAEMKYYAIKFERHVVCVARNLNMNHLVA